MNAALPMLSEDEVRAGRRLDEEAGFGSLSTPQGNLPMAAMSVRVKATGLLAGVALTQTFVNAHAEPLEATYIFPLPDRFATTRFRFEVAGRVIEGTLKERGEARQEYDAAIQAGHRAAIAEEDRPDVFSLRVGNLMPGETATVRLDLSGPLAFADGEATFRFPLVVAPRYIPGVPLPGESVGAGVASDTDAVPDASRITPAVLLPGYPNPVKLALAVDVDPAGLPASDFRCSLHAIQESTDSLGIHRIALYPDERLDRDFVLRWKVGGTGISTSLVCTPDPKADGEGTFALTLVPPIAVAESQRPRDVAFVLDRSGSMGGWKMVAARRAMVRMVQTLTARDRFAVLAFDDSIDVPPGFAANSLTPATDRNRFVAENFLAGVDARGGTEMAEPLEAAADAVRSDDANRERILVLVTDGQVGNEDQILKHLAPKLRGTRVFALGIDQAVNAGFLNRLAELGRGQCELIESEARLDEVGDRIHRLLGTPVLTGVKLDDAGFGIVPDSVTPSRLPDLFAGSPLTVFGRYRGSPQSLTVSATAGGKAWKESVANVSREDVVVEHAWARGRVRSLEDRFGTTHDPALPEQIVDVSLRFGVLCRFTAYVAVDRSEIANPGGVVREIAQPVELPAGWQSRARFLEGAPSGMRCASMPDAMYSMPMRSEPAPVAARSAMPRAKSRKSSGIADAVLGAASNLLDRVRGTQPPAPEVQAEETRVEPTQPGDRFLFVVGSEEQWITVAADGTLVVDPPQSALYQTASFNGWTLVALAESKDFADIVKALRRRLAAGTDEAAVRAILLDAIRVTGIASIALAARRSGHPSIFLAAMGEGRCTRTEK